MSASQQDIVLGAMMDGMSFEWADGAEYVSLHAAQLLQRSGDPAVEKFIRPIAILPLDAKGLTFSRPISYYRTQISSLYDKVVRRRESVSWLLHCLADEVDQSCPAIPR
jgi:hypothetical protein